MLFQDNLLQLKKLIEGENQLNYNASLISTDDTVKAGSANVTTNFYGDLLLITSSLLIDVLSPRTAYFLSKVLLLHIH